MNTPASRLGARLARERKRQCKSMDRLARIAGTHASEISRLERGLRDPRLSTIDRIARALDVSVGELVDGPRAGGSG
jgi:transcriptional regulator with XRE-family HTH domain